jgi:large subunit ribosomal protein L4
MNNRLIVVDNWTFDTPSTKSAQAALKALGISGSVLVVVGQNDANVAKSFRNLFDVQVVLQSELNTYDVLCNEWIVFSKSTLPAEKGAE